MHELTIAANIIDIIVHFLSPDEYSKAESVKIKLGYLSNVFPEALKESFDALKENYNLNKMKLEAELVPLQITCNDCLHSGYYADVIFNCSNCNSVDLEVLNGEILEVSEIIISENI